MSIRMKLLYSYAAMLIVPLILIVMISLLMVLVFSGDLQKIRNLYEYTEDAFNNENYLHMTNELKHTINRNPALLTDSNYLNEINQELKSKNAGLALRKDGRFRFLSDLVRNNEQLTVNLPPFQYRGFNDQQPAERIGEQLFAITQLDFETDVHQRYSVFIMAQVDPITYYARKYFLFLFLSMVVILVLTHMVLTYMMSKHIIKPLQVLKHGAGQIKEGNLDFQVQLKGKDEIGQLGTAFEEMRVQLRESIQLQLQYEANRKELISNISHDLKTPIAAIQGYVDGILDGVADSPEKTMKYVKTISAKAEEMDDLIDELFLYSKLDLKRLPFTFEPVDVRDFFMDWAEEQQFELEKKGVILQSDIYLQADIIVLIDRDKFKRVLANVMENSVKYMDKASKQIRLHAFASGDHIQLEITDNGQGIESDALPHIFERFYRAEDSRNTQTGGSGLGLAIAKQIMEGHGGEIVVESTKGTGTTIMLVFPILKKEKPYYEEDSSH